MSTEYLSPNAWMDNSPYTLFIQPFPEGYDNFEKAFSTESVFIGKRITHFLAGVFLWIPLVNAIALLALRYLSSQSQTESVAPPPKPLQNIHVVPEPEKVLPVKTPYKPPFEPTEFDPPSPKKVVPPVSTSSGQSYATGSQSSIKPLSPISAVPKTPKPQYRWVTREVHENVADYIHNPHNVPMTAIERTELMDAANNYYKHVFAQNLVDSWYDKGVKVAMKIQIKLEKVREKIPATI